MQITFKLLRVRANPSKNLRAVVLLTSGDWDDYSFKTSFGIAYFDHAGKEIELGTVKIGYVGQPHGWTRDKLQDAFEGGLPDGWFSLGQDVGYYKKIYAEVSAAERPLLLQALRDVVADAAALAAAKGERVFNDSLTRTVSPSTIDGQFRRVLSGNIELTDFRFRYAQEADERNAPVALDFEVKAGSKPPTNVHVLIGRNGVGKTTLLNNMVGSLLGVINPDRPAGGFYASGLFKSGIPLPKDYFSGVVSVTFSAFDPFIPPADRPADRTHGPAYVYIGMKKARANQADSGTLPPKTDAELVNDFVSSFRSCISQPAKRARWLAAIQRLESDANFAEMGLGRLLLMEENDAIQVAHALASRMSSGHSIVLLTITMLVDAVEEKTLVLLDEPESHLHPPLLSAFTRALSELLYNRNGLAIVATHSPVVLQEVPRSCAWILTRTRAQGRADRPPRETFGENVGILTRETFGLEVSKSGFHQMMATAVDAGGTYESILKDYGDQLGAEARAILLSKIAARDSGEASQE